MKDKIIANEQARIIFTEIVDTPETVERILKERREMEQENTEKK
jgi:PII-like signaling protein